MIEWVAEWLTALLGATGTAGIFFAMMLESACIPLPSEVILPFAGILVAQGALSFPAAVAWALAGQMAGSVLTYYAGLYGGRAFILRYGKYVLIRRHELELAERWFQRYGEITALVTRMLPGVRTFISLPAGVARMPLWRFLLYSFLGALPWTAFLVWAGVRVGKVWQDPRWHPYFRLTEILVAAGLLGLAGWYLLTRRHRSAPWRGRPGG